MSSEVTTTASGMFSPDQTVAESQLLMLTGVAVEKLLPAKFAKIKSRQEAPQSIFSGWLDIFYPQNLACSARRGSFSTATGVYTQNPRPEANECY